jgi:cytochrome oxidase assembly protein ShyY1
MTTALILLQVILCAALLALTVWRLNHMTEAEKFLVRWYHLGALSLSVLGVAACMHPHPLFIILPALMLAAYGVRRYAHR